MIVIIDNKELCFFLISSLAWRRSQSIFRIFKRAWFKLNKKEVTFLKLYLQTDICPIYLPKLRLQGYNEILTNLVKDTKCRQFLLKAWKKAKWFLMKSGLQLIIEHSSRNLKLWLVEVNLLGEKWSCAQSGLSMPWSWDEYSRHILSNQWESKSTVKKPKVEDNRNAVTCHRNSEELS